MSPGPVAVLRFRDLPDAEMAQSVLRSAGIDSFLADQNIVRLDWLWSDAMGGVKVVVRAEDEADARELLKQAGSGEIEWEDAAVRPHQTCPQCGSRDLSYRDLRKRIGFATLAIGLPLPIHKPRWRCARCGYTWQEGGSENPPSGSEA